MPESKIVSKRISYLLLLRFQNLYRHFRYEYARTGEYPPSQGIEDVAIVIPLDLHRLYGRHFVGRHHCLVHTPRFVVPSVVQRHFIGGHFRVAHRTVELKQQLPNFAPMLSALRTVRNRHRYVVVRFCKTVLQNCGKLNIQSMTYCSTVCERRLMSTGSSFP